MTTLNNLPSDIDESTDAHGNWREAWSPVLSSMGCFDPAQISSFQHELLRRYRENGLAFGSALRRQAGQRPWQLDLMPQMMASSDWETLETGLAQRARLKAALLKDLYGEQRVLREGIVPAKAVYAHKGFIESAVGMPVFDAMPLFTADVSRSPSGDWYVTNDVCQAPNGIGYALENRLVLSGMLASLYRQLRVRRVAEYFKHMRAVLFKQVDSNARCVILGYGATHHYHFEQAYLAKYLGYTLVQANDLTARGEHVWLKTVDGLQRVDVIFRFIDDADIDPLAAHGNNSNGVPGLLYAAREGGVIVINPIGSAAAENPAFNAWLPELCKFLLNEELLLLTHPTYWLGNEHHKEIVDHRFNSLLIREIDGDTSLQDPSVMSEIEISRLQNQIATEPERYVALERIGKSTTPTLLADKIESRPLTMRVYLMTKGDAYRVMPGGLGLLHSQVGGYQKKIRDMEFSKDVWVVSEKSVPYETLLQKSNSSDVFKIMEGELPSSVAESLFWLGRYTERIEGSARVLRAVCQHLQSDELFQNDEPGKASLAALLKSTTRVTGTLPGFFQGSAGFDGFEKIQFPDTEIISLLSDPDRPGALPNTLEKLSYSADTVRDRLSSDMLQVINSLEDHHEQLQLLRAHRPELDSSTLYNATNTLNKLLFTIAAFSGLTHENMTQGDGWRFLQIGKCIERASQTSAMLSIVFRDYSKNHYALQDLLGVMCSDMTYRSRYRTLIEPSLVLTLLLTDESNPRSLGYQFNYLQKEIQQLPGRRKTDYQETALRTAAEGLARIRLFDPATTLNQADHCSDGSVAYNVERFFNTIINVPADITDAISAQYFTHTELPSTLYSSFDLAGSAEYLSDNLPECTGQ